MKIIEVSQFVNTKELSTKNFQEILAKLRDNISKNIYDDFTSRHDIREVSDDATPICGYVWLKESASGLCEVYAANYDSSD